MDSVASIYAHVQSTVITALKREWQKYPWEEADIDDKADKLLALWQQHLQRSGALRRDPPSLLQSLAQQEAAAKEALDTGRAKKRGRVSAADKIDKRFKSAPIVDAPLTYPALPPASTYNTEAARYAMGVPTGAAPQPAADHLAPAADTGARITADTVAAAAPATTSAAAASAPGATATVTRVKAEPTEPQIADINIKPSDTPQPVEPAPPLPQSSLLTEPLSVLDDDSDLELDLSQITDVCICQYEKVAQVKNARNKWKVTLRDGILNVKGKDYVFSRLQGELQW